MPRNDSVLFVVHVGSESSLPPIREGLLVSYTILLAYICLVWKGPAFVSMAGNLP